MNRIARTIARVGLFLVTTLSPIGISAQQPPQGYYRLPLAGDIGLSATFAEIRTGHFHAGIDIRTGGVEGKAVYAVADGYVCGIRISPWGGGKMLYVKHPNGYTSVYMHLSAYVGEIGRYVEREQYREQSYAIVREIEEGVLPVKKGQVIARSGNTGGSGGPHLHFELRRNGTTINPLLFGFPYMDNIAPVIRGIKLYPASGSPISLDKNGVAEVGGPFYIGVYATDAAEGSTARNGIDHMEIYVDGALFFKYVTEGFPLDSSRMSNATIDYTHFTRTREAYLVTRVLPGARGEWIAACNGDGWLRPASGSTLNIKVIVFDIAGNRAERSFAVKTTTPAEAPQPMTDNESTTYTVAYDKPLNVKGENLRVTLPVNTLYADGQMGFRVLPSEGYRSAICMVELTDSPLPPNQWYTLSIKSTQPSDKAVIVRLDGQHPQAYKTTRNGDWFTASVRDWGRFAITTDTVAPRIAPLNLRNGVRLKGDIIRLKISDDLSGINTYSCYLNDKWILAEYDGKTATLTINVAGKTKNGNNTLRVEVSDMTGNTAQSEYSVVR